MGLGKRSSAPVAQPGPSGGTAPIVAVLAIAVFMSSLDLFIVNLAFPSIAGEFAGTGLGSLSWVLNAYTIIFAAVLIPAGRWADQVGRRRALVAGLALFTGGSLLCGMAPGVAWLVAARVAQAIGAGVMVPASLSLLLAAVPVGLALVRVVPNAMRLGSRRDSIAEQSALARGIWRDHLFCLATIAGFLALQLGGVSS